MSYLRHLLKRLWLVRLPTAPVILPPKPLWKYLCSCLLVTPCPKLKCSWGWKIVLRASMVGGCTESRGQAMLNVKCSEAKKVSCHQATGPFARCVFLPGTWDLWFEAELLMTVSILISPSLLMPTSRSKCHCMSFAIVEELNMRFDLETRGKCQTTFIGIVLVPSQYLLFLHCGHDSRSFYSPQNRTYPKGDAWTIMLVQVPAASSTHCSALQTRCFLLVGAPLTDNEVAQL